MVGIIAFIAGYGSMTELGLEGHAIKNPDSATSIAIRALTGTYKWVLSGTPLHKYVSYSATWNLLTLLAASRNSTLISTSSGCLAVLRSKDLSVHFAM